MFGYILSVIALSLLSISFAHAGTVEFPAPTGPYQVGSTYRHWIDESRDEFLTDVPDDRREIMVRIWYPAEVAPDAVPMPAMPNVDKEFPILNRDYPGIVDLLDELAAVQSHSYRDAPLAESDAPYPVLLYSHGLAGPEIRTLQLEELASHGYVVVATHHTFIAPAVVFPDGRVVQGRNAAPVIAVADQVFVMDRLTSINADDPEGVFTGHLQTNRFGMFGMSVGSIATYDACRVDERCAAYMILDGRPSSLRFQREMLPPVMYMSSYGYGMRSYYERWAGRAYYLEFTSLAHFDLTDVAVWPERTPGQPYLGAAGGVDAVRAVNAYLVAFFDKHIKGVDTPLLDGPSPDFPNVEFVSRNIE